MKLGVSFNVFNGEELLEQCANSIRPHADFICVIYQNVSNFGKNKKDLTPMMDEFVSAGVIDKAILYEPNFTFEGVEEGQKALLSPTFYGIYNEMEKRNLGLACCKANECTHLMDMDTDEFYKTEQIQKAKEKIEAGGYDASFCQMQTYYKRPTTRLLPSEQYYVPLIYKITNRSKFESIDNIDYPVLCDGKRRIKSKYPYVFSRGEIEMHHLSYVRKDEASMRSKFENCSSIQNFPKERIDKLITCWLEHYEGQPILFGKDQVFQTIEVPNYFNIKI